MTTWAASPAYGRPVLLGPTQEAVYRFAIRVTDHGRRPSFTLSQIAEATGKPVSSVHDALGRLRALGLIGVAARMGRTGGHRLWRIVSRKPGGRLDAIRHRLAIARIYRRWYGPSRTAEAHDAGARPSLWDSGPPGRPDPGREGPSPFREAMKRAGFTPWWSEEKRTNDDPRPANADDPASRSGGQTPGDRGELLATVTG